MDSDVEERQIESLIKSTHNLNVENQMLNSERLTCKVGLSFKSV